MTGAASRERRPRRRRMRLGLLGAALGTAVALSACGEINNTITPAPGAFESINLMLDWSPNADQVGIYQALADGDFRRAALNVHLETPADPSDPLKALEDGQAQVAITYEPELLLTRNDGVALVSVAALVQQPLTSIVSLGSEKITSVADLRGKTVGIAGLSYQQAFLHAILSHAGIPDSSVKTVNVGEGLVPAMLSKHVQATLGAYWNYEAIKLAQLGRKPNVIRMGQAGIPPYNELVLAVTENELVNHPYVIRAFVQAVARGYEAARANPAQAVSNLIAANPSADLSRKLELASVRATIPYWFPPAGRPWGWQNQTEWNAFGQWMIDRGLMDNPTAVTNASTNEVLPGQGV